MTVREKRKIAAIKTNIPKMKQLVTRNILPASDKVSILKTKQTTHDALLYAYKNTKI